MYRVVLNTAISFARSARTRRQRTVALDDVAAAAFPHHGTHWKEHPMELDDLEAKWQAVSARLATVERALQVPTDVRPPANVVRHDGGLRLVHATL
jgi:DNA-directed RNA polymerase specialized sigma24 family protein